MVEISGPRKAALAVTAAMAFVTWGMLMSLQPAFYPTEAEARGAMPHQYGFVFGVYSLAAFIAAPLVASYGPAVDPKILYNSGGFAQGLGGIAFGFLDHVDSADLFIGLSYFLRAVEGMAAVACSTSMLGIMMALFPNRAAAIAALNEMFIALGFMLGSAAGAALYAAGGFSLPFYVVGAATTALAVALVFLVPRFEEEKGDQAAKVDENKNPGSSKELRASDFFRRPPMLLPYADSFVGVCGTGTVQSFLEPHLKNGQANATHFQVGMAFFTMAGTYVLVAPVVGHLCDRVRHPVLISLTGNLTLAVAFLFLGPAPFLYPALRSSAGQACGVAAAVGFGYAMVMVPSFARAHRNAVHAMGFPDGVRTGVVVGGLWNGAFYLGSFSGPTASGFIVEAIGFKWTTIIFTATYLILAAANVTEFCFSRSAARALYQRL